MTLETMPGDIGVTLREARQRGTLSLRQVSDSTKVPVDILQAIERNDISRVPGGLYVRGYVRSFAAAVGLDPEATVAAFVAQFPSGSVTFGYPAAERAAAADALSPITVTAPTRAHRGAAFALLRFAAVGALCAALGVYMGMAKSQERGPATRSERTAGPAGAREMARVAGAAPSAAVEAPLVDEGAGPVAPAPVALSEPPAIPETEPPAVADLEPIDSPPVPTSPLAVVVAAKSPSWVILTVDGRKAVNRLLQVGERETLEARRDLVLTAGDAGAIVMTLNGRPARSIGRPGETVTTRVSSTNFRDYLSH